MKPVLLADSIGKSFRGRRVLSAATLRAFPGQIAFLVGRNGCGKSTLLKIAAGHMAADHGVVSYGGRAYFRARWHVLARRGLWYMPDRELLSPGRTLRQFLYSVTRQFDVEEGQHVIDRLGLSPHLDSSIAMLSTGERRRVEVALAVVRQPLCLLADEPFRNVEPIDRPRIADAFRQLADQGCALVVTGHEVEDLLPAADSIVRCHDGTTDELGPPALALTDWQFVRDYIGEGRRDRMVGDVTRG